jgi:hypothetical protein
MRARTLPHGLNPTGLTESTLDLPAHWASALVNGDYTSFDDSNPDDIKEQSTIAQIEDLFGSCTGVSDTPEFRVHHDASADGVLPCDCLTYTFISHNEVGCG